VFAALEAFGEPSSRELKNKSNGSMKAVRMIFNILFGPPGCWLGSEASSNTSHNQAGEVKKILKSLVTVFWECGAPICILIADAGATNN